MSTLTSTDWKSQGDNVMATAQALAFPEAPKVSVVREKAIVLRDTLIVVAIQLVFRASLMMRRWNY